MKPTLPLSAIFCGLFLQSASLHAYKQDKNFIKIKQSERPSAWTPEQQLKSFTLPEGFVIELVASEKNGVINPIDMTFDDAGRLWTQTAEMYPMDPFGNMSSSAVRAKLKQPNSDFWKQPDFLKLRDLYKLKTRGQDRVIVIDDPTQPVTGQLPHVVEGLTMPQSILPYKNGVYIAHGSEMLYFEDKDNDGKFEHPTHILSGFSFLDSHTMSHSLVRGPGGWIHFSHGAMNLGEVTALASGKKQRINYSKIARFSLDHQDIELVSSGLNNIWGFQLRADGQWYGSEANDKSHSVVPMEPGTGFLGIGNDKIRSYQPMVPVVHSFRVGGTGISGLVFSDDDANGFPKEWQNLAFLANPITNTINTVRVDRDATGKIHGERLEDLLKCSDEWFRPVNIEFGPDGCLYIADWYNKVVSHNEIPRTDPSRDKSHGRIWRIRHKDQKPAQVPNLIKTTDKNLAKHLLGKSRWEKRAAWHQIADRQVTSLLPEIKTIIRNKSNTTSTRIHAIWAYESLRQFDLTLTQELLKDQNHNIRREAIRSLATFDLKAATVAELLGAHLDDPHCMVRSQVMRTLEEVKIDDPAIVDLLIKACKPDIAGNNLGGSYERSFERYLARKALESYRKTLSSVLNSKKAVSYPISNLLWASQALDKSDAIKLFSKLWKLRGDKPIDADTLTSISNIISDKDIFAELSPYFNDPKQQKPLMELTLANQDRINLKNLAKAFTPALKKFINGTEADQALAIKIEKLVQSNAIHKQIEGILTRSPETTLAKIALPIFLANPQPHQNFLTKHIENKQTPFQTKVRVLEALNRCKKNKATPLINNLLKNSSDTEKTVALNYLVQSREGVQLVLKLLNDKTIKSADFSFESAQALADNSRKNKQARAIYEEAKKRRDAHNRKLVAKVDHYFKTLPQLQGNPQTGAGFFNSCTACHAVGDTGYDIAPALDGSANRELKALLTAIVHPNAAVEGGYNLHKVVRKDGEIIQGYLYSNTPQGITIAEIGNRKTFIPKRDIRSETSISGKSFMPEMFSQLPDQTMADLIAYIKTLN